MTKKIKRVNYRIVRLIHCHITEGASQERHTPVHISFWLNGTLVSGAATSGRRGVNGLIKSRKRTESGQCPIITKNTSCCYPNSSSTVWVEDSRPLMVA